MIGCNSDTSTGEYFDNSLPPVLRIKSGDTVAIETGTHSMGGMDPGGRTEEWIRMYQEEMAGHPDKYFSPGPATGMRKQGERPNEEHPTGPIYIEGAEAGDILQVEILEVLPDDSTNGRAKWYWADLENRGFGPLPEKHAGRPGGNEGIAGAVLYLPIRVKGAGVVTGEFRPAQGEDEVDAGAPERTFRSITMRMTIRKDLKKADRPFISTPNHRIALGIPAGLEKACGRMIPKTIRFFNERHGSPDYGGYAFCSMGADRHVTRFVKRHETFTSGSGRGRSGSASPGRK